MEVFLETFGFDQFVKDGFTTHLGEGDLFAKTFDTFLQPTGLFCVGNVHILQRKCAAIGALHDFHNLAHGTMFKPQYVIKENRAIHVSFGEAIAGRIQLGLRRWRGQAKRIKVRRQMPANTIGADQHQRADGIEDGLFNLLFGNCCARFGGFGFDLLANYLGLGPLAIKCCGQIIVRNGRPIGARPAWAGSFGAGDVWFFA